MITYKTIPEFVDSALNAYIAKVIETSITLDYDGRKRLANLAGKARDASTTNPSALDERFSDETLALHVVNNAMCGPDLVSWGMKFIRAASRI